MMFRGACSLFSRERRQLARIQAIAGGGTPALPGRFIPITVDDAALLKAVLGVVLPSVAIHNPKSKTKNGITPAVSSYLSGGQPPPGAVPPAGARGNLALAPHPDWQPLPGAFKGGQNIRANVACTALERPRARLWPPRFDRLSAGAPAKLERGRGREPTSASQRHTARRRSYVLSAPKPGVCAGPAQPQQGWEGLRQGCVHS